MLLRSTARDAGLNPERFDRELEFVEWSGLQVPVMALERARDIEVKLPVLVSTQGAANDYMWCRLCLETAIRYQHSSGDAMARLLFAALTDEDPPPVLHISTFERHLPGSARRLPVVLAAKELRRTPEWEYITAFSNTLKHMSIVDYHHHIIVGESSGFAFKSFEYKGRVFSECSQDEFEGILRCVRDRLFHDVMGALFDELMARASG
jgi:hypothetical protein